LAEHSVNRSWHYFVKDGANVSQESSEVIGIGIAHDITRITAKHCFRLRPTGAAGIAPALSPVLRYY